MTAQSHPLAHCPVILLTRPADQSARFAAALRDRFPEVSIVTSPLIAPTFLSVTLPLRDWTAVIFTSETAVRAAERIVADGWTLPRLAICVGDQTARAAQRAKFQALSAGGDAAALVALVLAQGLPGPMLYMHGRETRVNIAERLESDGIETISVLAYAQDAQSLNGEATALLQTETPVIAPVFSPRTAQILSLECARIQATAPLHIVAISAAAGATFPAAEVSIAAHPDAKEVLEAIASRLSSAPRP